MDVPTIRPHKLSIVAMHTQTPILMRVCREDGTEGWSEATTIGGLNCDEENLESIKVNIDMHITPLPVSMKARGMTVAMARVRKTIQDSRLTRCALETALLDAQARRLGVPLSELLGGRLRGALPVAWAFASGDTKKDITKAETMLAERRRRIFKLKISLRPVADDVAHALAIKQALGDAVNVRVGVNQAWSELDAANDIAASQAGGIDLTEQPARAKNRAALECLARQFAVPMMADETLRGPPDAFELVCSTSADASTVKITQSGGLVLAMRVIAIAQLTGVSLYGGTMLEETVGTIVSARVSSTFGELQFGTELFGLLLLTQELLTESLQYRDLALQVPTGPGLGVEIDRDKLTRPRRQQRPPHQDTVRETTMLLHARMNIRPPANMPANVADKIKAREEAYSQDPQHNGKWCYIQRLVGEHASVSAFDVQSNAELYDILTALPLSPHVEISMTPLYRHPSSAHGSDA